MVHVNKKLNRHLKNSAESNVMPQEEKTVRKTTLLKRIVPRSRKELVKVSLAVFVFVAIAGAIPFPYAFTKSTTLDFATENQENASLELGDLKVLQEGHDGLKIVNIESFHSIWGRMLGLEPIQQREESAKITKKPANKIVANGSRKYQYMHCSNGGYSYYSDEQFKDPNTGFTSKSEDDCKKKNLGAKIRLADSPDRTVNNQAPPSTVSRPPVASGCKEISVPFETVYQNVSYLPRGTQQIGSQGANGFIIRCPGKADIKASALSQTMLVGTGKTVEDLQAENEAAEITRQQEEAARDQRYYLALANCIQSLRAQGMQQSSAEYNCRGIIRR